MNKKDPPKLPLRIFKFYCSQDRLEELEGDLYEVFNELVEEKGLKKARLIYWWLVIRSFRSYALKRTKMKNRGGISSSLMFLKHNLKVAWRNLWKNKTTTAINIIGLAVGISGFMAIFSISKYEFSFDNHIPDQDRIYRIFTEFKGVYTGTNRGGSTAMPAYLRENYPQLETVAVFYNWGAKPKIQKESGYSALERNQDIIITDSSYFNIVDQYTWLYGSPAQSLRDPKQVVLLKEQAEKYFSVLPVIEYIGKKVIYQDSLEVYVSGIVEQKGGNTDFVFTDFISTNTMEASFLLDQFPQDDWSSISSSNQTFVKLKPEHGMQELDSIISGLNKKAGSRDTTPGWVTSYNYQAFSDLHFNTTLSIFDNGGAPADLESLKAMIVVSLALLVIAIFNFINLETAQAANKSKEVGLRKVLGSTRKLLMGRFLSESTLLTLMALVISLPLTYMGLRYFEEFVPAGLTLQLSEPSFWAFVLILLGVVSLLAGMYPAFVISSFSPIVAIKSKLFASSKGQKGSLVRKLLISLQFVFSQVLIVATLAMLLQISFMLNKELGFTDEGIITIETPWYGSTEDHELYVQEISSISSISDISLHGSPPASRGWSTSIMRYGQDSTEVSLTVHRKGGDENYLSLFGLELIAGRNYKKLNDSREAVINRYYAEQLGFETPNEAVGIELNNGDNHYMIVGVLEDFFFQPLRHAMEPIMISYNDQTRNIGIKLQTADIQGSIDQLSEKWEQIYPNENMQAIFLDETVENFYRNEKKTSKLASTATGIAIFISCLGLFGLISFVILQRSKEVGVRKVLGASSIQISSIISREFLILIGISFAIATPLAYWYIAGWMEGFEYRTSISWWVYALGGLISAFIAIVTVGIKVWKAASSNPVESLKYE